MVRWVLLASAGVVALSCSVAPVLRDEPRAVVLRDFQLVDVAKQQLRRADIVIEDGVVVARQTLPQSMVVVEGHGAFLLPALWDLKTVPWGNSSARSRSEAQHVSSVTRCLSTQLYFGVGHVGIFAMDSPWIARELQRVGALEVEAAEAHSIGKALCATASFECDGVTDASSARQVVAERQARGAGLIEVSFVAPNEDEVPGLSEPALAEVLHEASTRRVATLVLVSDWERAEHAVDLGARAIYGLPEGPIPEGLVAKLQDRDVAWVAPLARYLELDRLLGNAQALSDPLMALAVRADVRSTYLDPSQLWRGWWPSLERGRARRDASLAAVRRASRAGVKLVSVSDAGSTAGVFQGYTLLASQAWLEQAEVGGWARLAAATTTPAELVGRRVGFEPGNAADFVAYDTNPVERAENLRQIRWVMRRGQLVDRERLLPDLERGAYRR